MDQELEELASKVDYKETSPFQITYFLIGQEPTDQAKLQRCLHEISSRVRSIKAAEMECQELSDVSELHQLEMEKISETAEGIIRKRMVRRKIDSIVEQKEKLVNRIVGWEREADHIRKIYKTIIDRTPLKDWNDYQVQIEYWSNKLSQELGTRRLLNMPADLEVIKTILSLPETAPIKREVLQLISKKE